jgi:hypothetical protein
MAYEDPPTLHELARETAIEQAEDRTRHMRDGIYRDGHSLLVVQRYETHSFLVIDQERMVDPIVCSAVELPDGLRIEGQRAAEICACALARIAYEAADAGIAWAARSAIEDALRGIPR